MKEYEFRVFFEGGKKSINSGQVNCILGLRDIVFVFGTVPKNSGLLESLCLTNLGATPVALIPYWT